MSPNLATEHQIFKDASSTFYRAAQLFPKPVRDDVFRFYSFVRVTDDYVDVMPQQVELFQELRQTWETTKREGTLPSKLNKINELIIKNLLYIVHKYRCDPAWVDAFFNVMQDDLDQKIYQTLDDTLAYTYGSAEVVGMFMAKIMQLPDKALPYARLQGRTFQYINFIRDLAEDTALGRCYFPREDLERFNLSDLEQTTIQNQPADFNAFLIFELARYEQWQTEAEQGFKYIPQPLLVPLQQAGQKYAQLAGDIRSANSCAE